MNKRLKTPKIFKNSKESKDLKDLIGLRLG
jgi:hypothetical protein